MTRKLILASASPRRQELLKQVHLPFTVSASNIDETLIKEKSPAEKVKQLAILKGKEVLKHYPREVVLAADTVVSYEQTIFEKPANREEAQRMITTLSGKVHEVYTGVMICAGDEKYVFAERTEVEFWPLTKEEIDWYIKTDDPYDKAGAYGIQSLGAMLVKRIQGDYYNVVGLPVARVMKELRNFSIYPISK